MTIQDKIFNFLRIEIGKSQSSSGASPKGVRRVEYNSSEFKYLTGKLEIREVSLEELFARISSIANRTCAGSVISVRTFSNPSECT